MAGTNHTRKSLLGGPSIILVEPQMGENIGTAARAMLNFGLADLRLVQPRDSWPNEKARAPASRADVVIDNARVYSKLTDAVQGIHHVFATTARSRDMLKPVLTPQEAMQDARRFSLRGESSAVLFGREKSGLNNDDVAISKAIVTVPVNPAFASLNIAQAVLILAYEWFLSNDNSLAKVAPTRTTRLATQGELVGFFNHLERELDISGFLFPPEKRPGMVRNIRNIFSRNNLMEQEIRTLRGIIGALTKLRRRRNGSV